MSKKKLKSKKILSPRATKNCVLYTVIDFEGLINFYSDTVPPDGYYDADSFNNVVCDQAPFVGPSNQILLLEPNVNYSWQMQALSNLSPNSSDKNLPVITQFEFTYLSATSGKKSYSELWNEIFDVEESGFEIVGNKLICVDFDKAAARISTRTLFSSPFKLSYSIQFNFILNGTPVTGSIDPLINNRTDD